MGEIISLIHFKGKVGNVIGRSGEKGRMNIMEKPVSYKNPQTPAQMAVRAKLKLAAQLAGLLGEVGRTANEANGISPRSRGQLIKQLMLRMTVINNRAMINPYLGLVRNPKGNPITVKVTNSLNVYTLSVVESVAGEIAKALLVYDVTENRWFAVTRRDAAQQLVLTIPDIVTSHDLEVYAYAIGVTVPTSVDANTYYSPDTFAYLDSKGGDEPAEAPEPPVLSGTTPFTDSTMAIITAETGAEIRYTTDGTTPTLSSQVYTAAINLTDTTVVKAIAVVGGVASAIATKTYTKQVTPATVTNPQINGEATFETSTQVTMTAESGAEIRYTTDGSNPTTSSTLYSAAITISDTTTVKAIAVKNGATSGVTTRTFTKQSDTPVSIPAPTISLTSPNLITITATGAGVGGTIYYTKDGTNPTTASYVYTEPFQDTGGTVKAFVVKDGVQSAIAIYQSGDE